MTFSPTGARTGTVAIKTDKNRRRLEVTIKKKAFGLPGGCLQKGALAD
jgi:hypothetical protein